LGISVSDKVSHFSRFTMKFIEIAAAGVATAVSGYLIAHLGMFLSAPAPAPSAAQVAPSATSVVSKSARAQPAAPVSANANEQRPAPAQQDATPPAVQPARTTANAPQAVSPHKHTKTDTSAAESKPRDEEAVAAQVRAALANAASRPAPSEGPPHQADVPPGPPAVEAKSGPADGPLVTGAIAVTPRAAEIAPQPVQQAPAQPDPLATVEIKSLPVAGVEELQPAAPAQKEAQAEDKGLLSAIKKIRDLLRPDRSDSHAPAGDAPRPPMPVGE
jgi:hypothetical protein